jgi:hypothetical protein
VFQLIEPPKNLEDYLQSTGLIATARFLTTIPFAGAEVYGADLTSREEAFWAGCYAALLTGILSSEGNERQVDVS